MLRFAMSSLGDGQYEADVISDKPQTLEEASREVAEIIGLDDEELEVLAIVRICAEDAPQSIDDGDIEKVYKALKPICDHFLEVYRFNFLEMLVERSFESGCAHMRSKLNEFFLD